VFFGSFLSAGYYSLIGIIILLNKEEPMPKPFTRSDYILWTIITLYTGIIYATLSLVTTIRKYLVEKYGYTVYDTVYWIFGLIAAAFLIYYVRKFRGRQFLRKLALLILFGCIYAYYLGGMKYPVERIHFLEYGLLGALVFTAFSRHNHTWTSLLLSLNLVYWLGLGDEAIQGLLANRVGEIRDSIVNLFSGMLGIAFFWLSLGPGREKSVVKPFQLKLTLVFLALSTLFTGFFLYTIHGFGYCVERKDTGRFYTSFAPGALHQINTTQKEIPPDQRAVYDNEALRHLFQREFYYTNDFKASDGTFYRDYLPCYYENRILEIFYKRFMQKHTHQNAGALLGSMDTKIAAHAQNNPVVWPDSVRTTMEHFSNDQHIYCSRVKQTMLTTFSLQELAFACGLILILLGFLWARIKTPGSPGGV